MAARSRREKMHINRLPLSGHLINRLPLPGHLINRLPLPLRTLVDTHFTDTEDTPSVLVAVEEGADARADEGTVHAPDHRRHRGTSSP